jgi:hypothetical protein
MPDFWGIFARSPGRRLTMSGQSQESPSFIERTPWARYTFVLLLLVIGTFAVWATWNDASASTSVLHHRIFLMGVALVWAVGAVTLALVPWWKQVGAWLIAAHLLIMGLYIGLAIATTDWPDWTARGWLQGWWAFPLIGGQIQQVLRLLRAKPNLPVRSFRLVKAPGDALPETGGLHP